MATTGDVTSESTDDGERSDLSARLAVWAFALAVVAAVPVIFHAARDQWFFLDEWDFLADRDLMSLDDLLRPHNEHWSTLPVIGYRLVWQVTGLNHYWPYLMMTVVAHLVLAALLRVVMVRAGSDPWISTAAAVLFAYFGSGWENIGWAFQIGLTGALATGVAGVLLVDHDDRDLRRDGAASLLALASLMFSGIGVVMVVAVGVVAALRQRVTVGLAVVAVPAAAYVAWTIGYGSSSISSDAGDAVRLAADIVIDVGRAIGPFGVAGWVLAAAAVGGVAMRLSSEGLRSLRSDMAASAGLFAAGAAFLLIVAVGRGSFTDSSASRYVYVVAALVLPLLVVGLSELARRWRAAGPVAVAVLVLALIPNVDLMRPQPFTKGSPSTMVPLAHAAAQLPDEGVDTTVDPLLMPGVDVPWLRSAVREGKVPDLDEEGAARVPALQLMLGFQSLPDRVEGECGPVSRGGTRLGPGDVVVVPGPTARLTVVEGSLPAGTSTDISAPALAEPGADGGPEVRIRREGSPVVVRISGPGATGPAMLCRP